MQNFLDIFDIYLLEAVINGILLGGVLVLLPLGVTLTFGVVVRNLGISCRCLLSAT